MTIDSVTGLAYSLSTVGGITTATITSLGSYSSSDLIIPPTVGGHPVVAIGNYAFFLKSQLISVLIPASVTSIGKGAFENCSNLISVTFLGDAPTVGQNIFGVVSVVTTIIYYTSGKTGWGTTFADRFTAPAPVAAPPALPVKHNYSIYFRK